MGLVVFVGLIVVIIGLATILGLFAFLIFIIVNFNKASALNNISLISLFVFIIVFLIYRRDLVESFMAFAPMILSGHF